MTIISAQDKDKIKRVTPKATNKIIDATVARLYIAYPGDEWQFTGLSGAIVLMDDLVGNTFFLKMVDIIGSRGVMWDQELYVNFAYNQDRAFFHTFELEECFAGLLFEDSSDAAHFYKRVTNREKYGSKKTVGNKNAIALKKSVVAEKVVGPRGEYHDTSSAQRVRRVRGVLYYNDKPPEEWRALYEELAAAGISEDMIADNREFIKEYINSKGGPLVGLEPPIPRKFQVKHERISLKASHAASQDDSLVAKTKKAPPPPPPPPGASASPVAAASPVASASPTVSAPSTPVLPSSSPSAPESEDAATPEQVHVKPTFRAPPPMNFQKPLPPQPQANANTYPPASNFHQAPSAPVRAGLPPPPPARGGPPPPPPPMRTSTGPSLPPRGVPLLGPPQFANPPVRGGPPPPPPRARGQAPPPPPSRSTRPLPGAPQVQPQAQQFQQIPPQSQIPQQVQQAYVPPPPPQRTVPAAAPIQHPPPQIPPSNANPPLMSTGAPPPPPLMNSGAPPPPPPPMNTGVPPPPPMGGIPPPPPMGGIPPPPPMGGMPTAAQTQAAAPPLPQVDGDRNALLASIRGSGLSGLRKIDKSQLDKPSILLQEAKGETPTIAASAPSGGPPNLADALSLALNKRKEKLGHSDDEDDGDDW
ncbi:hypothetical protein BABINDRAFT_159564 [Babjeviella inositovora NRRL Y-12698]|uniref:WH1 domain-containing protein n=1 Tax=Babjeviella inositovora NRRL Y-12698 TaxID=984486 RepID=A0A1E3QZN2_9ASCO|nr:uncharacterized protein BABINDRAFT_159564 [Babjeviella inositovora NRRL Y-12698]ODQ83106.1 hypothetical protein BABINDRAFT_159564 [Babjeviella inositovora NRRL Y-12698]